MTREEKAQKLSELYDAIAADSSYRTQGMGCVLVPGAGSIEDHALVFVGEAPGREEEIEKLPFVGQAGKNLETLLGEIGLSRRDVFITNLLKYRPVASNGSNRPPSAGERHYALPYLVEELRILSPELVVCLGLSAARALLDQPALKMAEAHNRLFEGHGLRIFVTYHPSPFNFMIAEKRKALHDAFRHLSSLSKRRSVYE